MLTRKYGITLRDYETLLQSQGGKCAICKTENPLGEGNTRKNSRWTTCSFSVDHCHQTGIIRGLLCNTCNRGLGFFKDNLNLLKEAINYL